MFSALQVSRIFPTVTKSVHSCVYKGTICQMTGLYITKYSNYRIARNLVRGLIWPFSNLRRKVPNKNSHYFSLSFAWLVGSFHVHTHWQKLCRCMVLVERWQTILYTPCATATLHRLFIYKRGYKKCAVLLLAIESLIVLPSLFLCHTES